MDIKLINIGFSSIIAAQRVTAIVDPKSAMIQQIVAEARERGELINATYGHCTRSVIMTDSGHIILSALQPETLDKQCPRVA
jgi:extracellular matrix regulatory protein A